MMNSFSKTKNIVRMLAIACPLLLSTACAQVDTPDGKSSRVGAVTPPYDRFPTINEKRDPITRVKLGRDVLVPRATDEDPLPKDDVGPFELRGETLASALQLVLDEYDVSLAFESDEGLTRRITVANLRGELGSVVKKMCALADLYCHHKDGTLTIKDTQSFVVDLPPLNLGSSGSSSNSDSSSDSSSSSDNPFTQIATGLEAIIGAAPTVDETNRIMIYSATQRTQQNALQYFDRIRKNTALIVFETNVWEVTLDHNNRVGIDWASMFTDLGNFDVEFNMPGAIPTGTATPIAITPTFTSGNGEVTATSVLEFISTQGTVKTISQPQITVLSGSSAVLEVSNEESFISGITRTPSTVVGQPDSVSTTTETANSGLTMRVTSAWDEATVYGRLDITLEEVLRFVPFDPSPDISLTLPETTQRSLQTEVRVRPGDAILIAGLVSEKDDFLQSGPGFMKPLFATSRGVTKTNTELVFLLRPRIVIFDAGTDEDTPPIVSARDQKPKVGDAALKDITGTVKELFGAGVGVEEEKPEALNRASPLPQGISKEDMAPLAPNEDLPMKYPPLEAPVLLAPGTQEKGEKE